MIRIINIKEFFIKLKNREIKNNLDLEKFLKIELEPVNCSTCNKFCNIRQRENNFCFIIECNFCCKRRVKNFYIFSKEKNQNLIKKFEF